MDKYIVHFRNAGFQIVEAESKQDAISQIDAVEDIEGCWEYDDDSETGKDDEPTVTKKETEFLTKIVNSEYAEWVPETGAIGDWVCSPDYDMKVTRGLITSLSKKGIIDIGENKKGFQGQDMTWISINVDYLDIENQELKIRSADAKMNKKNEWSLLERGSKITYEKEYMFGKTAQVSATVVMIKGQTALLDNGDTTSKYVLRRTK